MLIVDTTLLVLLYSMLRLAAQCIVIGPVCVFVGLLPWWLEIACIDPHQTGSVGEGSDHLQLIKFWPSCAPRKGVCGRAKNFGSALLQPAHSVCVSLSTFFIIIIVKILFKQTGSTFIPSSL